MVSGTGSPEIINFHTSFYQIKSLPYFHDRLGLHVYLYISVVPQMFKLHLETPYMKTLTNLPIFLKAAGPISKEF